ncbi:hypothetical protein [Nautilia lithotrophica]
MCAIKRLLKKYKEEFVDKKLKWGAKTSEIKDELEKYKNYDKIYLIEFEDDAGVLSLPNIEHIDHHNENSLKPSSIEQVAEILGHKLSRFEKAVALNDKGYIRALKNACFNDSDIQRIRKYDRKCQNVTPKEEAAAAFLPLKKINYFPYEHFSPLADRLFAEGVERYVIYNDKVTIFYGFDNKKLKQKFKNKKVFYGGGEKGYFGIEEKLDERIIEKMFNEKEKKLISTHIFILPFLINDKEQFKEIIENNGFKKKDFKIKSPEYYNEYVYFYKYTRETLYKSFYYEQNLENIKDKRYIIKIKDENSKFEKTYELEIEDISLRLFDGDIGVLSFHLNNYDYDDKDDILKINEYGRRIFPQYIDKDNVLAAKNSFLPDEIKIILDKKVYKEDFCKFAETYDVTENENKLLIPNFIKGFIGDNIDLILDDRMFVVSFYMAPNWLLKDLKDDYINNEWWYKYVFVDGKDKMCQDDEFCAEIIKKSTYPRWRKYGTFWGISRYSFVGIGNWDLMLTHTKTMYYQMSVLVLLYRSLIISFSKKIQSIIKTNKKENLNLTQIRKDIKNLYHDYLKFLNGIYFREITPQEQGIELYKKFLEITDIKELVESFDREMEELDNYVDILEEKERNENLEFLSILGAVFIPSSLIVGVLGINGIEIKQSIIVFLIIMFGFIGGILLVDLKKISLYLKNKNKRKSLIVGILILLLSLIIGVFYSSLNKKLKNHSPTFFSQKYSKIKKQD